MWNMIRKLGTTTGTRSRNRFIAALLIITALLIGATCHPRVSVNAATDAPIVVKKDGYGYIQIGETFTVLAFPGKDSQAKEDLCTKSYVCTYEQIPVVVFKLERHRK